MIETISNIPQTVKGIWSFLKRPYGVENIIDWGSNCLTETNTAAQNGKKPWILTLNKYCRSEVRK